MQLQSGMIGVDQGSFELFSDFADGGEMWTGHGPRERSRRVKFKEKYRQAPTVHVSLSMWDTDNGANQRAELSTTSITKDAFTVVFRTWGDSRVARVRVSWMAIGELAVDNDWMLYDTGS